MSTPPADDPLTTVEDFAFPTETEIYILPSGEIVVADLPTELDAAVSALGKRESEPQLSASTLPDELETAFAADAAARALFDAMPPSHQRETVAYVTEAKKAETRRRRAAQTLQWLREGRIGAKSNKRP